MSKIIAGRMIVGDDELHFRDDDAQKKLKDLIVQEKGNSKTAVMSQAAATEEFDKLSEEIVSVKQNSETTITPNMINGGFVTVTGVISYNTEFALSELLEIRDILRINRIYSAFAKDYAIAYFDEDQKFISMQNVIHPEPIAEWVTLEIPENAIYLRFNTLVNTLGVDGVKVAYNIDAEQYKQKMSVLVANDTVVVDNIPFALGTFAGTNGVVSRSDDFVLSDYLTVENIGEIYSALAYEYPVLFYDQNKNYIGYQNTNLVMEAKAKWYTIEAPENAVYFRFNNYIPALSIDSVKVVLKYTNNYIEKQFSELNPDGADIAMFDTVAVCGDSFTSCDIYINGTGAQRRDSSWGKVIEKMRNISVNVYAKGGVTVKSFLTNSDCLPKLLNENPSQLYVLSLGINDYATTIGTVADITDDYEQNADTFFGNYGRIIDQIKAHAPNSKIIICKTFLVGTRFYEHTSKAISEIATHYEIPLLDTADSLYLKSTTYRNHLVYNHPTAVQQSGMAKEMIKLIGKTIDKYTTYFEDFYQ